jgi:hypothetical protein
MPVAYLSVLVPIVFSTALGQWPGEVEVINVADLAGTELACAPDLLRTAFGTVEAEGFDPDVFTANAIWLRHGLTGAHSYGSILAQRSRGAPLRVGCGILEGSPGGRAYVGGTHSHRSAVHHSDGLH